MRGDGFESLSYALAKNESIRQIDITGLKGTDFIELIRKLKKNTTLETIVYLELAALNIEELVNVAEHLAYNVGLVMFKLKPHWN